MSSVRAVGRRGVVLLFIGLIYVVYGSSVLTAPDPPFMGWSPLGWEARPWGWAWVVCGLIAVVAAVAVTVRRDPAGDAVGFAALMLTPAVWALLHTWSWIAALTGDPLGRPRGWVGAVVWSAEIILILVIAGWPEPPRDR